MTLHLIKTRNNIIKKCKNAGLYRVQKSVFLGDIESNKFDELKLELDSIIDKDNDSVYMFTMTKAELNKAGLLGQAFDKELVTDEIISKFFNENQYYITPSDMIEFLYCKRYIYYMKCLGIDQNVEKRFKVMIGREIHEKRGEQNKNYLPKKIGSIHKMIGVNLVSEKYGIKGNADEVHTLADGTMAPLDYKFARYDERLFKTYKNQLVM